MFLNGENIAIISIEIGTLKRFLKWLTKIIWSRLI